MFNTDVVVLLDDCEAEIVSIETIAAHLGITSNVVPYLSKYALIKSCGTIEQSFKTIVADHCSFRSKSQVKHYLTKRVRNSSSNPSFANMCTLLKSFDPQWHQNFRDEVNNDPGSANLKTSLQSLVDARNEFAHGGSPRISITDVIAYFRAARQVIEKLDSVVR